MPIATGDVLGSDQLGVFLASVGGVFFHPREIDDEIVNTIEAALNLEPVAISIGGSQLVGSLIAGNSRGLAVADILPSYGDVIVMESGINTAGNLLLINEQGVIASPAIPQEGLELLGEVMKVDVKATTIAGDDVVGSLGVCNNQGVLLHPDVTPEEVKLIQEILDVPPMVGTVAFGSPFVGAGMVVSDNGAFVGSETTGPELNRIEDALQLY